MSSASESPFKPPPIVECVSGTHCLGIGKKVYVPHRVCSDCLQRHDPQQLRIWANSNPAALLLINEETARKHVLKRNIEARGRYLCAFEDPDYQLSLLMHDLIAMLAPPPKPHCAFGPACDSRPEGQEHGPEICSWCRNLSIDALFKQADKLSDNRSLKRLIHEYMRQLEREHTERVRKVLSQLATIALPHPATTVSPNMEPREHLDKKMLKEIDTNFNDAIKKTPSTPSTPKHEIDSLSSCCPEFADPDRCIARLRQHSQNGDPCLACSIAHPRLLRLIHGFKSETNDHILAIIERQHTFTMPGQYACVSRHPRYHYFDKKVPAWMDKLIDARINRDAGNILYSTQIQCPTLACEEELCPPCLSALRLRAPEMVEALYQSTVYFSRFGKLVPTCGIHSPPGEHYNFSPA
ncbi:hypothetical protein A1F96_05731 [Pyrenophora tritici-repentis]|nr:hypothetical protein A1F96_05731 [Pyrenophora tritici-repentis]